MSYWVKATSTRRGRGKHDGRHGSVKEAGGSDRGGATRIEKKKWRIRISTRAIDEGGHSICDERSLSFRRSDN